MYTIGVDIGASKVAAALVKGRRVVLYVKTAYRVKTLSEIRTAVFSSIKKVAVHSKINGIGLGVPCALDQKGKVLSCANVSVLRPKQIARALTKIYRVPVFIENDVRAAALAELKYGIGRKSKNFVFVAFGTGIGGAVVIDGKLYKGALGWAGEFGHSIVQVKSLKFKVKSYAEWEEICTKRFLKSRKTQKDGDEFAYSIALGLVNITYFLAPEYIVVGGGLLSLWDSRFNKKVLSAMRRMSTLPGPSFPKIIRSKFGERAGVVGVSLLMYDRRGTKK